MNKNEYLVRYNPKKSKWEIYLIIIAVIIAAVTFGIWITPIAQNNTMMSADEINKQAYDTLQRRLEWERHKMMQEAKMSGSPYYRYFRGP